MANLISPGVAVTIIDDSFFVAGAQSTVPLFFVATEDEKVQVDGVTPALGTFESGVLRVVTSAKQALELYGVPKYFYSVDGTPHHGDVRNEYGLDALLKYLDVGNRAYVVRANVNLNDNYVDIKNMWTRKVTAAAELLAEMVDEFIASSNEINGLVPGDSTYKETVTPAELTVLVDEAMKDVFKSYSFSSELFAANFLNDNSAPRAGSQTVDFETSGGFLQESDVTGLSPTVNYAADIRVVGPTGDNVLSINVLGENATTFGDLISELNAQLVFPAFDPLAPLTPTTVVATAELVAGRIVITSLLEGVTSAVEIVLDGGQNTSTVPATAIPPLFASLSLFKRLLPPVPGANAGALIVFDDTFSAATTGLFLGVRNLITNWATGSTVLTEFTGSEAQSLLVGAAADYDNTKEFRFETTLGANDSTRRAEVVSAVSAEINNPSNGVRAENLEYNVVVAPGFPEVVDEMLRLSTDMLDEVFVIGETPFDKPPTGPNGVNNWARTPARGTSTSLAYAYPHGISTNIDGRKILTTASATLMRVFAINDRDAELWWAPAGIRRGLADHLETIGYVTGALGGPTTFVENFLDLGTRDELYEFPKNINPITFIPGRGILVMGQKTTAPAASALDRINVSRLVKFIKRELRKAMFAFLFEPNDKITRDSAKFTVDSFLSGLMSRRALYDFASVSDDTNNTPDRVDRNELWVDVAIKPVKAVEFIYIPIRIVNTGADLGANARP